MLLLIYVVSAPYPYGAVLPRAMVRLELFAFVLAALAFVVIPSGPPLRRLAVPFACIAALVLLAVVQLIPMPGGVSRMSPASARVYREASEVLALFGTEAPAPRISIAPQETVSAILLTLAYSAAFLAAARILCTRMRRRIFAWTLALSAAIQVGVAMGDAGRGDRLSGTFVNPNHFAAYLGLALAVVFGLLWASILAGRDRAASRGTDAERIERKLIGVAPAVLVWAAIAGGIALTRSRGAVLTATLVSVLLIGLAALHRRRSSARRRIVGGAAIALVCGAIFVAWSTGSAAFSRFGTTSAAEMQRDTRVETWRVSLAAWREFPIFGSGLGAFKEAFRRVQPRELTGLFEHAHSDPLQMLVSGGVIGFAASLFLFGSLLAELLRMWLNQSHREESAITLGAFGSLLGITLHGLVEFNLSVPAIAATLAMIVGLGWSAGTYRNSRRPQVSPEGE